jgi:hypothetical protein
MRLTEKDISRFWRKVARGPSDGCWPWTASTTGFGYGQFGAQGKVLGAHRVAYYLGYGVWPETARLICGNPACCNPRHISDPTEPNRAPPVRTVDMHPQSRHTDDEVRHIRELYATGKVTQAQLAARYGVTKEWIGQVVRGERRKKAGGPLTALGSGRRAV